ncbi:Pyruvate kinase family protein [Raphanus sativus]|uniref:Pyruvate kinase n=1 Tax=Raphanus sativus TaxID=3726 RepID=A0A9W3DTA5_RAPSA|nr:pyruvate kinase, cytosolic isozyme-like [Raphanus sativus]KAJ4896035.1 Pyruvate kinase family protein [Raphanus sativus]
MEKLLGGQTRNGASKTKIVCTLGPSSRSVEMIEKLLRAGMNVARFNFSHGSHEYHQETLDNLRTAVLNTGILCAVMLDTKGPEIRTGFLKEGKPIELIQGQEITISIDYTIKGDSNVISMSYKRLAEDVKPGHEILCSDGSISLKVLSCDTNLGLVRCRCENSAVLGERKNVNLPGIVVDLPTLTEKDKEDILQWGVPNKINIIALSFVRKGSDLDEVRELLGVHAKSIMLMSKVENQEGVANVDEIMEKTDAFMVARGDLGMEIPTWKIFRAQKKMIEKANALGKPIVTATQMLESMTKAPRPTRAEATDVANAVLDGTDCVMLSGETAAGAHPEAAVKTMSMICKEAEEYLDYEAVQKKIEEAVPLPLSTIECEAASVVSTARKLSAKAIVVVTKGGYTAGLVAKYRPRVPILTVVDQECSEAAASVASRGLVYRGIVPVIATGASTEEKIRFAVEFAKKKEMCNAGDLVVTFRMIDGSSVVETRLVE